MKVRRATIFDLDQLSVLFDLYRQFYKQTADLNGAREFLRQRLSKNESVCFLATAPNDEIVGFAQLFPTFSSISMRPVWILNDLFVEQTARDFGVGSLLLKACEEFALESGAKGLTLKTARDNSIAQRLYSHRGWTRDDHFLSYEIAAGANPTSPLADASI